MIFTSSHMHRRPHNGVCSPVPPRSRINFERHSSNQRRMVGDRRHPSPTTRHIRETRVETNPSQGHHFTRPGKPASSLPCCCVIHAELSPPAPPPAPVRPLGFLGHLNDIGLKVENVSHDFHLLSQVFGVGFGQLTAPHLVLWGWGASDSVRPRRGRVSPSQAVKPPAGVAARLCGC